MPSRDKFSTATDYYETILHELSHWAEARTDWDSEENGRPMTELAAEMAACFVGNELGIPGSDDLTNHAAYLQSWLQAMRNDPKFIFWASTQASRITDFLMGFVRQAKPQVAEEEAA